MEERAREPRSGVAIEADDTLLLELEAEEREELVPFLVGGVWEASDTRRFRN